MNHLENIAQLFSKNFVESPLLDTFEAEKIEIPTGKLIACDPIITSDMLPFEALFPVGKFPVFVYKEKESNCIAYVEIRFSDNQIKEWKMATTLGQDIKNLEDGEIFGYPVETGMGCLMDWETQFSLNELEEGLFMKKGDQFLGIYEEFFHQHFFDENGAIDQFATLVPNKNKKGNIFAFETGYGEGFYASYIAFDEQGIATKIVTEFIEIAVN